MVDVVWLLCDPGVYAKLTRDRGFDRDACVATIYAAITAVLSRMATRIAPS